MIRLARTMIATIAATAALAPAGILAREPQHANAGVGLLEAHISEQPPIDFRSRGTRKVVLSFVVGAAPACTGAAAGPHYAFLIDADRNLQTGTRTASFPNTPSMATRSRKTP